MRDPDGTYSDTYDKTTLQDRLNDLQRQLNAKSKLVDECRELLKRSEEENSRLKETIKSMVSNTPRNRFRQGMHRFVSFVDQLKFQSPITKK